MANVDDLSFAAGEQSKAEKGAVIKLASRLNRLGTETAYAVALESQSYVQAGKTVYPFHIGDLNFPSPQAVKDGLIEAVNANKTGYCPAAGIQPLRVALAERIGGDRNVSYTAENVSVQPGGKPVISKFFLTLMEEGDEVLYPSPGYPIYESMLFYFGGIGKAYKFTDGPDGFGIDMEYLKSLITPGKTKFLVLNSPHNPTGSCISDEEYKALAALCVEHDLFVLSDEPYFDLVYEKKYENKSIVSYPGMKDRTVLLTCFSKSYAMTGWRMGCAVGPEEIIKCISKLNVNIEGCTSHPEQWAALACLQKRTETDKYIDDLRKELNERRNLLTDLLNDIPGFQCHKSPGTFYLFPNVTQAMKMVGETSVESFRRLLLSETGVSVCTREHFGDLQAYDSGHYIRFAYSACNTETITKACEVLKNFMQKYV